VRGAPDSGAAAMFSALGAPQPAGSPVLARAVRLLTDLRAAGADDATTAIRAFQFVASTPQVQTN